MSAVFFQVGVETCEDEETGLEKRRQVKRGLMDDLLTGRVRVHPEPEGDRDSEG